MNNKKVDRYLDRVFESEGKVTSTAIIQLPWSLLAPVTAGLGAWNMYGSGPNGALTAAHVFTWAFIMLNAFLLFCVFCLGILRATIQKDHPKVADAILFAKEYRSNWLSKITAWIDTPLFLTLSLLNSWFVAAFILVLMFAAERVSAWFNKTNRTIRRKELAKIDEAKLHSYFATKDEEEKVGSSIDLVFGDADDFNVFLDS